MNNNLKINSLQIKMNNKKMKIQKYYQTVLKKFKNICKIYQINAINKIKIFKNVHRIIKTNNKILKNK